MLVNTIHTMCVHSIHPNLRNTVYCSAMAAGGVEEWDFGWSMYKSATIASEADKLMYALSCTKQPWLLNRSALHNDFSIHFHSV